MMKSSFHLVEDPPPRRPRAPKSCLRSFSDGRDENNLAEFPLALLTDRADPAVKSIEFSDTIVDKSTGLTVERRVCVTGSDRFGLPRPKDEDVLLALIQLTRLDNNFESPEVFFTKHDIIELLGWENRGWAYERIEESLNRWKGTSLHFKNAWRDNRNKQWRDSGATGVIEYFHFADGRGRERSKIAWNRMFFESFQAGYLKRLDLSIYRGLTRPAARRAFRFLDKRFHQRSELEFELLTFACDKLGFARCQDVGKIKERLRPALAELERIGFIERPKYRKERVGRWHIQFRKGEGRDHSERRAESHGWSGELVKRGVSKGVATSLARSVACEQLKAQVERFDELRKSSDPRVARNPAGFLVAAIRDNYPLAPMAPRSGPREGRPKGGRTESADPVADPARDALDTWLKRLPEEERQRFSERARASASLFQRDTLERLSAERSPLVKELLHSLFLNQARREKVAEVVAAATSQTDKSSPRNRAYRPRSNRPTNCD